jgi:hypothetical protein
MKHAILPLVILLALALLPAALAEETAPETFLCGDYSYTLLVDGTAEIKRYTGEDEQLTIPDQLDGHVVTSIGDGVFYECRSLINITIPSGVTSIGDYAFSFCGSLSSVAIPDSVTSIGNSAFYCCASLSSVTIPDSVTSIGYKAFYDCPSLTTTVSPNGYARQYCEEYNIPYVLSDSPDELNK